MSYERLTHYLDEKMTMLVMPQRKERIQQYIYRLAELEDMIESGQAVILPCKVGDTVYKVYGECGRNRCPHNGDIGQWRCHYKGKDRCKPFVDEIPFDITLLNEVGKTIFTTKEAAEAKLNELRRKE